MDQPPVFTSINQVTAGIVAFFVQFLPLLLLPFVFKLAGGIIGRVSGLLSGYSSKVKEGIKGNINDQDSLRNVTRKNMKGAVVTAQAKRYRTLNNASRRGGVTGRIAGRLARVAATGNVLAKEADLNKQAKERIYSTKDNGDDAILNARTATRDPDGVWRTLDGKPVTDTERALSRKFYKTMPELQSIEAYRETKTLSNEDSENYIRRFGQLGQQEGWNEDQINSNFIATGFARQDERGELKHGRWQATPGGGFSFTPAGGSGSFYDKSKGGAAGEGITDSFLKETYYKKGSFKGANMLSSHPRALLNAKKEYTKRLNDPSVAGDERENAQERLRQVLEIEQAFETPMLDDEASRASGAAVYTTRMAGANPGTIAAFNELKAYGSTPSSAAVVDPSGYISRLQGEIKNPANAYETKHERERNDPAMAGRYLP